MGKPNIEKMKAKKDVKGLIKALKDEDEGVRRDAADAPGGIPDAGALSGAVFGALEALIKARQQNNKLEATVKASAQNNKLEALDKARAQNNKDVRETAKRASKRIEGKKN